MEEFRFAFLCLHILHDLLWMFVQWWERELLVLLFVSALVKTVVWRLFVYFYQFFCWIVCLKSCEFGWFLRLLTFVHKFQTFRKKTNIKVKAVTSSDSNAKKANLFATKKDRVKLPKYDVLGGRNYHISEFLSQPSGIAAVLNTKALQSFQSLDANTYRFATSLILFWWLNLFGKIHSPPFS